MEVTESSLARFEAAEKRLQAELLDSPMEQRLQLLEALSRLGQMPERPYPLGVLLLAFLENYLQTLGPLRDGETIADRVTDIRRVLVSFSRGGVVTERLRLVYAHIERDLPEFESMGAILPMPPAVDLCHTMLATGLSGPMAIQFLLRAALREPLMHYTDDAKELRKLKMIELLLRVDFLHTQELLAPEVLEYLAIVRSLRYYDREVRRDTPLSYQLAYFLRKHAFPARRAMLGPYALKVCDPEARINFEPVEERFFYPGMTELPFARKARHLEAVGWRNIPVHAATWQTLCRDAKAAHVRKLLRDHDMLEH